MTSTSQPLEHVGAGIDELGKAVFVTVGPFSREVSTTVRPGCIETIVVVEIIVDRIVLAGMTDVAVIVWIWPD